MTLNACFSLVVAWCVLIPVLSETVKNPPLSKTLNLPTRRLLAQNSTARGCFYQGKQYEHGNSVLTPQPCLNCTCSKGVLLCYLRVCPLLSTPPPGCFSSRREGECCPTVVCGTEKPFGRHSSHNKSEEVYSTTLSPTTRPTEIIENVTTSEPINDGQNVNKANSLMVVSSTPVPIFNDEDDDVDFSLNTILGGCYLNGSLYAEGSAILSGSFCEYCYCIRGKGVCTRPKCHLSIDNCAPHYSSEYACCPTSYVCGGGLKNKTTTTTTAPPITTTKSSLVCNVDGMQYHPGEAIPNAGHCNRCYCSNQGVRCEKIECSPAMEGCYPVVPDGHCCPVEYNCNKTSAFKDETPENSTDPLGIDHNSNFYITEVPQRLGGFLFQESAKVKKIIEPELPTFTSYLDNATSLSDLENSTLKPEPYDISADPQWDEATSTFESVTQTEANDVGQDVVDNDTEIVTESTPRISDTTVTSTSRYPYVSSYPSFSRNSDETKPTRESASTLASTTLKDDEGFSDISITVPTTSNIPTEDTRDLTSSAFPKTAEPLTTSQPTTTEATTTHLLQEITTVLSVSNVTNDEVVEGRESPGGIEQKGSTPFRENDRIIYFPEVAEALQEFINFRRRDPDAVPSVSPVYKATTRKPEIPISTKHPSVINFESVYTGKPYFVDSFGNFQERVPVSSKDGYKIVNSHNHQMPFGSHKYYRKPTEKPYQIIQGNSHHPLSLYRYGPVPSIYSHPKKDSVPGEKDSTLFVPGEVHYRSSDDMMQNDGPSPSDNRKPLFAAESRDAVPDIIVGKVKDGEIVVGKPKEGEVVMGKLKIGDIVTGKVKDTHDVVVGSDIIVGKMKDRHGIGVGTVKEGDIVVGRPKERPNQGVAAGKTKDKHDAVVVSDVVVGKIKNHHGLGIGTVKEMINSTRKESVEIITAPSAFDSNDELDFGRSHLINGPDAKQSRAEPTMKVVSLKQVFQVGHVSPDFNNETPKSSPSFIKEKSKPSISYVSFSQPTFESFLPSSDPLLPSGSRVSTEHLGVPLEVRSQPPGDPKPLRVIPFLAEDAVSKNQNQSVFVGIFRQRPSSTTSRPSPSQTRPSSLPDACVVTGRVYKNGESISKSDPCRLCRCFYGKELCHHQSCPDPPKDNCRSERMPGFCCPRYTCGERTEEIIETTEESTSTSSGSTLTRNESTQYERLSTIPSTNPPELTFNHGTNPNTETTTVHKQTNQWQTLQPAKTIEAETVTDSSSRRTTGFSTVRSTVTTSWKPTVTASTDRLQVPTQNLASSVGEENNQVWGLLRVSGCNIYGKFYNLNEPVTELSGPCNSCVCSVHGVECNALC